jgi:hypothetical protein
MFIDVQNMQNQQDVFFIDKLVWVLVIHLQN